MPCTVVGLEPCEGRHPLLRLRRVRSGLSAGSKPRRQLGIMRGGSKVILAMAQHCVLRQEAPR